MNHTRIIDLVLVACGGAGVAAVVVRLWYRSLPPIPAVLIAMFVALALIAVVAGRWVRRQIAENNVGVGPWQAAPLLINQLRVWGTASALTGAFSVGAGLGAAGFLAPLRAAAAVRADIGVSLGIAVAAVLCVVAGCYLERSCEVPPSDDGAGVEPQSGTAADTT